MIKERHILSGLFIMIAAMIIAASGFACVSAESSTEEPIRAVHMVKIDDTRYCFFVKNNVVLTPADLVKTVTVKKTDPVTGEETEEEETVPLTNEELTALVLEHAGLYMKASNCNEKSHSAITIEDWNKKGGSFLLSDADIERIRNALPSDGNPEKFYMDVLVAAEPVTEDTKLYSTFKITSPSILFVEIATKGDAEKEEEICEAIKEEETQATAAQEAQPAAKTKKPKVPKVPEVKEDPLPEFRTIKMTDRSGGPLEETLKDGDPVTLKWIEPGHKADSEGKTGFFSHMPGKILGLVLIALALAVILFAIIAARRKDTT